MQSQKTPAGETRPAEPRRRRKLLALLCYGLLATGAAVHAYGRRLDKDLVRTLRDDEVAVVYDALRAEVRTVEGPGKLVELPVLHELRVMLRSPVPMLFSGSERPDAFHVPEMHMRASDGSPMRFDAFALRYALLPEEARHCLEDTHAILNRAARLVEVNARGVLRERLSGYSAEQLVRHEVLVVETAECRKLLNEALQPHGLKIVEFGALKPRFDRVYEDAVERRLVSIAEIERLRSRAAGLPAELEDQLAQLERDKQAERDAILLSTASARAQAERVALLARTNADLFAEEMRRRGESERLELHQSAAVLTMKQRTAAEGRRAEVARVAALGRTAVIEAWIERLHDLTFRVEPPRVEPPRMERSLDDRPGVPGSGYARSTQ